MNLLWNIEILRALRVKSSYAFLKRPPGTSRIALEMKNYGAVSTLIRKKRDSVSLVSIAVAPKCLE